MNAIRAAFLLLLACPLCDLPAGGPRWHPPMQLTRSQIYRRDMHQRRLFCLLTAHPHGWPGHVVDHVIPLKRGGIDAWWNMQWQTIAEAKAKDLIE